MDIVHIPLPALLGAFYFVSEMILGMIRRAHSGSAALKDGNTTRVLWLVIMITMFAAYQIEYTLPQTGWPPRLALTLAGAAVTLIGLAIRWYAIIYLGRYFTVNVAIVNDHRLIDTGPYRWVRHPAYSGALLAFVGLGICMQNWLSLLLLLIGPPAAFLHRIRVEEAALAGAFGERYLQYMLRTARLIPRRVLGAAVRCHEAHLALDPRLGFGVDVARIAARGHDRRGRSRRGWCRAFFSRPRRGQK